MNKDLRKFAFWGKNNAPRIRSFQSFLGKIKGKDAVGGAQISGRHRDIAASFSCQGGCHCTP